MKSDQVVDDALAGAAAGAVSRSFIAPVEVVKVRLQLATERTTAARILGVGAIADMARVGADICRHEGPAALWGGNLSAIKLYVAYCMVQFSVFGRLRRTTDEAGCPPWLSGLIAGGGASTVATVATFPLDVIRTRGAVLGAFRREHTLRHALAAAAANPAAVVSDLYRGVAPAALAIVPGMGITFACFEGLRAAAPEGGYGTVSAIGAASGALGKLAVYPLDLAKRRLQVQGVTVRRGGAEALATQPYAGLGDCLASIVRQDGVAGLFRGIVPSVVKASLTSALAFTTFEWVRGAMRAAPWPQEPQTPTSSPARREIANGLR